MSEFQESKCSHTLRDQDFPNKPFQKKTPETFKNHQNVLM